MNFVIDVGGGSNSVFLATLDNVTPSSVPTSSPARTTDPVEARRQCDRARRASMTSEQILNRRARDRERYANMSAERRQARANQQNLRDSVRGTTQQSSVLCSNAAESTPVLETDLNNHDTTEAIYVDSSTRLSTL